MKIRYFISNGVLKKKLAKFLISFYKKINFGSLYTVIYGIIIFFEIIELFELIYKMFDEVMLLAQSGLSQDT